MPENSRTLLTEFITSHPVDAAKVLEHFDEQTVGKFIGQLPPALAATILTVMDVTTASRCLEEIDAEYSSAIVFHMTVDAGDLIMRRIQTDKRLTILASLPADVRLAYEIRLRYPPASAGSLMDPLTPSLPDDITVREAFKRLKKLPEGLIYHVYILRRDKQLAGFVTLRQLMTAGPQEEIVSVMQQAAGFLHPEMSRAAILAHPAWKVHPILPVITQERIFLGAISYRTLRLLEEAEKRQPETVNDTATALGELYWLGLTALFKGAVATLKNKERD